MAFDKFQLYGLLSWFMILNGLHHFYFNVKSHRLITCVMTSCIHKCWERKMSLKKVMKKLVFLEKQEFTGFKSGPKLRLRCYMKSLFVVITLIRIHFFYPTYMKRFSKDLYILDICSYWLLYNMLLAEVFAYYCVLWQTCRGFYILNLQLSVSRRKKKLLKLLQIYGKLLKLSKQMNEVYEYSGVFGCASKCWYQIAFGYEIFVILALPKSSFNAKLNMAMKVFIILTFILDAINLYLATDLADEFNKLREQTRRILRESRQFNRLVSIFSLQLCLYPERVMFLNVFAFDRRLTFTLLTKSLLFTICWLQGDYAKLKE
ncbi:uncharacterized protein Dwil_GK28279 [Drosophila willistoni]|uniref:Gustatory receptor n=1 Tax=Drosophila willistoni TaxID=7260 RepID=A0A0Q9WTA9_DROWI|nr:uncharacterized protein LOC26530281 [Drosophila willistoni]KRF99172.1 uncharacterized protein Dwil_GK28279 [Drosophila willistoni]